MSAGMAKPMPCEPPEREKIAVLMPITRPAPSISAPPELPGLIAASVWMKKLVVGDAGLGAGERRDDALRHRLADAERVADGEHDVADLEIVRGAELNRGLEKPPCRRCSFSTARSVRGSRSSMSASNSRLSDSEMRTSSAPSMTWLLVTTRPEASTITPEPSERCTRSYGPPKPGPPRSTEEAAEERILHQRIAPPRLHRLHAHRR